MINAEKFPNFQGLRKIYPAITKVPKCPRKHISPKEISNESGKLIRD